MTTTAAAAGRPSLNAPAAPLHIQSRTAGPAPSLAHMASRYARALSLVLFFALPVLGLTIAADRMAHAWAMSALPSTDALTASTAGGLLLARIVHPASSWAATALPVILTGSTLVIGGLVLPTVTATAPATGAWLSLAFGLVAGGGIANTVSILTERGVTDFINLCAPGPASLCIVLTPADLAAGMGMAMVALAVALEVAVQAASELRALLASA